jgi:hypothetical protein
MLLLATACGDSSKTSADTDADVAGSVVAATIGSAVGASTGLGVSTSSLPAFAELPPGAKAIQNMKINGDGKVGGTVSLEVDQNPAEVMAFYKAVFARHGMTVGIETETEDMAMINGATPDESKMLNIMVNKTEDGKTALNIVHSRNEG